MSEYYCVGWVSQAHGLKGEVFVRLFHEGADYLESLSSLGLSQDKAQKNLRVQKVQLHTIKFAKRRPKGLYVLFEGVSDRNQAEALKSQAVFIPTEHLVSQTESEIFLNQLLNTKVSDINKGDLGNVIGFSSNGPQDLLIVSNGSIEFELPYVEAFIQSFDSEKNILYVAIPEGLCELNPL